MGIKTLAPYSVMSKAAMIYTMQNEIVFGFIENEIQELVTFSVSMNEMKCMYMQTSSNKFNK